MRLLTPFYSRHPRDIESIAKQRWGEGEEIGLSERRGDLPTVAPEPGVHHWTAQCRHGRLQVIQGKAGERAGTLGDSVDVRVPLMPYT